MTERRSIWQIAEEWDYDPNGGAGAVSEIIDNGYVIVHRDDLYGKLHHYCSDQAYAELVDWLDAQ